MATFKLNEEQKITTGFKVPEHYFEDFSAKIIAQIQEQREVKVVSLSHRRKIMFYAAAAVIGMALMVPVYNDFQSKRELDPAAIENYISYQSNISQYDLINLLDDNDAEKLHINIGLEKKSIEEILINSADLENYLTD